MATERPIRYDSNISTVFLLGGSHVLPRLARRLQDKGYKVGVVTCPRQAAENIGSCTLREALAGIHHVVMDDIETWSPGEDCLVLGIGEAWTFSKEFRARFGDRLIDFMSVPLPRYRGGAHISWAIMRGERHWGGCLQLVTDTTVPGESDGGEIIRQWEYEIPAHCTIPQHWFDYCAEQDIAQIVGFLAQVQAGHTIRAKPCPTKGSLLFPRLRTADNGWIDWGATMPSLVQFIRAFDAPYPGARTKLYCPGYGDRDVALAGARPIELGRQIPLQRGLVLDTDASGITIAAIDGMFHVERVLYCGANYTDKVKVGQRFITPTDQLESALRSQAVYTPSKGSLQ